MGIMETLLALSENNDERNRVDPRRELAAVYKEVKNIKNMIRAAEQQLEQLERTHQSETETLAQLLLAEPEWTADIARAKDKMTRQRGLTLRDMLHIQQEVAKTEEVRQTGLARMEELRQGLAGFESEKAGLLTRLHSLKARYNQRAAIYNRDKAKADQLMASFAAKDEALLAELGPENAVLYREVLKTNGLDPVAVLEGEICGACRVGISKQMVKRINQGNALVYCENCMRLLLPAHLFE